MITNENIRYSVIAPVYNEEELCIELCKRISKTLKKTGENFEIILIDDGSTDGTFSILEKQSLKNPELKVVRLSKNFGQEPAIICGIEISCGEEIILIDGDLQDPPEVILDLIKKKNKNYNIVSGVKFKRKENIVRRLFTAVFYLAMHFFAQIQYPMNMGVFSIMDRRAALWLLHFSEPNKHISGFRLFIGFRQTHIRYERDLRKGGNPKSLYQLTRMGLNAFFAFSMFPLRLVNVLLIILTIASMGFFVWLLFAGTGGIDSNIKSIILDNFIIIAIVIFSTTLIVVAEYIGRIAESSKQRPAYIIDSITTGGNSSQVWPKKKINVD